MADAWAAVTGPVAGAGELGTDDDVFGAGAGAVAAAGTAPVAPPPPEEHALRPPTPRPAPAMTATAVVTKRREMAGRVMVVASRFGSPDPDDPVITCRERSAAAGSASSHPGWHRPSPGHRGCPPGVAPLQVPPADQAEPQHPLDELDPLLVLRQVLDAELLEQRAQVRLHRVDAEEELVGDLLVGRRGRVRVVVLVRPAQRGDDLPLGRRQRRRGGQRLPHLGQLRRPAGGVPEAERRRAQDERVTVAKPPPAAEPLAV